MDTKSLNASKYAPRTPAETTIIKREERKDQDKGKAARLFTRLRWKAESLTASYARASAIVHAQIDSNGYIDRRGEVIYPFVLGMSSIEAESMFKVDFFEFYSLLERYITSCLSIFDYYVSASGPPRTNVNALRFITNEEYARSKPSSSHQFHSNLLEALDDEKNPLHPAFGNQDVRIQLGLAKDYRNRWKDADEKLDPSYNKWANEEARKKPIQLDTLELQRMLFIILTGCDYALHIVHGQPYNVAGTDTTIQGFGSQSYTANDTMSTDEAPMEYMEDAMDLDD